MFSYWTKIGIGAVTVFGVGLTGVTVAKKGVTEIKSLAMGPVAAAVRQVPTLLNFRLEGRRIGKVRSIDVSSEGEWNAESVQMVVALEPGREPADLGECNLATDRWGHRRDAAFRCAGAAEVADLVEIGTVRFEPSGVTRPLLLERHDLRQLERSDLRGIKGSLHSTEAGAVTGQAEFDVQSRRGVRERGTIKLDASDGRAFIEIRGADGREMFRLRADGQGVSINANDGRGAGLLRLLAGENGVHIDVKDPNPR